MISFKFVHEKTGEEKTLELSEDKIQELLEYELHEMLECDCKPTGESLEPECDCDDWLAGFVLQPRPRKAQTLSELLDSVSSPSPYDTSRPRAARIA